MPATEGRRRLEDKVCVITGAGSGVGRVAARLFGAEGAIVVATDLDAETGAETVAAIVEQGGQAIFVHADLRERDNIEALAARCAEEFGRVDVLFNNAAIVVRDDVVDFDLEAWDDVMRVNVTAPLLLARALLPLLAVGGSASIVNHSSIDGVLANPFAASYSVSKAALNGLTRLMAHSYAGHGVRTNSLCSGGAARSSTGVTSVMSGVLRSDPAWAEQVKKLATSTPAGRSGTMEEVAAVALFLASDDSLHVNGTDLVVDGGRSALTPGTAGAVPRAARTDA
ncbi:SDR family NAD(P)-dependent oxidoreductase [Georgenia sp. AZ-5]|uniref:SDR family NAD(P)-dependent oxidoreductase n=1 Tax=Georgenia sp. AZ-5 TaxID=3367526 RepID=UPI00375424B6